MDQLGSLAGPTVEVSISAQANPIRRSESACMAHQETARHDQDRSVDRPSRKAHHEHTHGAAPMVREGEKGKGFSSPKPKKIEREASSCVFGLGAVGNRTTV